MPSSAIWTWRNSAAPGSLTRFPPTRAAPRKTAAGTAPAPSIRNKIAIDYSPDCAAADGLTHGNYLNLLALLKDTAFRKRLVSAEHVIARLRGRKSPDELHRSRTAIMPITLDIYGRGRQGRSSRA